MKRLSSFIIAFVMLVVFVAPDLAVHAESTPRKRSEIATSDGSSLITDFKTSENVVYEIYYSQKNDFYFAAVKEFNQFSRDKNDIFKIPEYITYQGKNIPVIEIDSGAFYSYPCSTVIIPDTVLYIDNGLEGYGGAFTYSEIEYIIIPENVQYIGKSAFSACDNLKSIEIYNPECQIYDDKYTIYNTSQNGHYTGTIYGYEKSTAHDYADKYGYNFVSFESLNNNQNDEPEIYNNIKREDVYKTYANILKSVDFIIPQSGFLIDLNGDGINEMIITDVDDMSYKMYYYDNGSIKTCNFGRFLALTGAELFTVDGNDGKKYLYYRNNIYLKSERGYFSFDDKSEINVSVNYHDNLAGDDADWKIMHNKTEAFADGKDKADKKDYGETKQCDIKTVDALKNYGFGISDVSTKTYSAIKSYNSDEFVEMLNNSKIEEQPSVPTTPSPLPVTTIVQTEPVTMPVTTVTTTEISKPVTAITTTKTESPVTTSSINLDDYAYGVSLSNEKYDLASLKTLEYYKQNKLYTYAQYANEYSSWVPAEEIYSIENNLIVEVKVNIDKNSGFYDANFRFESDVESDVESDEGLIFVGCKLYEKDKCRLINFGNTNAESWSVYSIGDDIRVNISFKDASNVTETGEFLTLLFALPEKPEIGKTYNITLRGTTKLVSWDSKDKKQKVNVKSGSVTLIDSKTSPTAEPTETPTVEPTVVPTIIPSPTPTQAPSNSPEIYKNIKREDVYKTYVSILNSGDFNTPQSGFFTDLNEDGINEMIITDVDDMSYKMYYYDNGSVKTCNFGRFLALTGAELFTVDGNDGKKIIYYRNDIYMKSERGYFSFDDKSEINVSVNYHDNLAGDDADWKIMHNKTEVFADGKDKADKKDYGETKQCDIKTVDALKNYGFGISDVSTKTYSAIKSYNSDEFVEMLSNSKIEEQPSVPTTPSPTSEPQFPEDGLRGDVNLDGKVTQVDATLLLRECLAVDIDNKSNLEEFISDEGKLKYPDNYIEMAHRNGDVDNSHNGTRFRQTDATFILRSLLEADINGEKYITEDIWNTVIK